MRMSLPTLSSLFQFFTSWPIPKDDFGWSLLTIYNVGTVQTCTAQGFFVHMSMGSLMYNCCMSLYYLLIIRYNWTNERFARRVEPFMHIFSIGFPLVTGIFLLVKKSFNPAGWDCYISSTPPLCEATDSCVRGSNASLYRDIFWFYPVWITIGWLTLSMLAIFLKISSLERRTARYHSSNSNSKKFAWQAFFYVGSMILTWILASSMHIYMKVTKNFPSFWLLLIATTMVPSQGFFNSIIYFSRADQGKKKSRRNDAAVMSESSSSRFGISRYFNQSRMHMVSLSSMRRKSSDLTTDVEDMKRDTTNVPEESKVEEQNIEEGEVQMESEE
jgi:hypothetical protein